MVISKPSLMRHLQFRRAFSIPSLICKRRQPPTSMFFKDSKVNFSFFCAEKPKDRSILSLYIFDSFLPSNHSRSTCMAAVDTDESFLFPLPKQGWWLFFCLRVALIHDDIYLLTEDREHNWAYPGRLVYGLFCALFSSVNRIFCWPVIRTSYILGFFSIILCDLLRFMCIYVCLHIYRHIVLQFFHARHSFFMKN